MVRFLNTVENSHGTLNVYEFRLLKPYTRNRTARVKMPISLVKGAIKPEKKKSNFIQTNYYAIKVFLNIIF